MFYNIKTYSCSNRLKVGFLVIRAASDQCKLPNKAVFLNLAFGQVGEKKLRQRLPIKWDLNTYNRDVNRF